jgi:hypothetical protein
LNQNVQQRNDKQGGHDFSESPLQDSKRIIFHQPHATTQGARHRLPARIDVPWRTGILRAPPVPELGRGYESWAVGEFGINPEHPPLLKAIATLPLLAMHLSAPPRKSPTFSKNEAYFNGRSLIYDNGGLETASKIIVEAFQHQITKQLGQSGSGYRTMNDRSSR